MTDLLRKPRGTGGKVHDITPADAGWSYVGFGLYRLRPGEVASEATGDREQAQSIRSEAQTLVAKPGL